MRGRGDISAVAPLRNARPAARCGVGMLVAVCMTLPCAETSAQTASLLYTNPLTSKLQITTRNPPRFQKLDREALAQLAAPAMFTPPASGAGVTGF